MKQSNSILTLAKVNKWDNENVLGGAIVLISILDGKWTTYRKIGEDANNTAVLVGGQKKM